MRVLHILNYIQKVGNGITNVAIDLGCSQAEAGNEVGVASGGGEYEPLLQHYGVKHFVLDQTRTPSNLLRAIVRYQVIIDEFKPDIIHAHMVTGLVLAKLLRGKNRYAIVSTIHNEFQRSAILMGLADRIIAVSESVSQSMLGRGISQEKLRLVRNGTIGSPRTDSIDNYTALKLHRPSITTVAGMFRRKGIVELIDAFSQIASQFPRTHLYLVGYGDDLPLFEAQARNTPFRERIHFEGFQANPQNYLLSTDVFVLASHREPFGLVISEAREAGCAIVASDIDGIPEALDNGQAGLLVPAKDSKALAAALSEVLGDSEKLQYWKEQSKQNIAWLNVSRVNEETLAVYRELVGDLLSPRQDMSSSQSQLNS